MRNLQIVTITIIVVFHVFAHGQGPNHEVARGIGLAPDFVAAGGISAGEELTQLNILHAMLIYNMIVVGGPTWKQAFGASGITGEEPFIDKERKGEVHPQFLAKGKALGRRVAELARRLRQGG